MNDETESLLQRYVDDRDDLSEEQLERLTAALRESEQLRIRLRDQLMMHELICQNVAIDRRDFPAQVDQRVRDLQNEADLDNQIQDMQSLASQQWDHWSENREAGKRRFQRAWIALGAAILVVAMAGFVGYQHYGPIAEFDSVYGQVMLVRSGRQVAAQPGMLIYTGDSLASGDVAHWTISYCNDRSILSGRGGGDIQLVGRRWEAKHIEIAKGDVSADARPQPKNAPMRFKVPIGEAVVVGTELHLLVSDEQTRLDVEHGRVMLHKQKNGDEQQEVRTGEYAEASDAGMTSGSSRWPMETAGLIVDSRFEQGEKVRLRLPHAMDSDLDLIPRGDVERKNDSLHFNGGAYQLAPFAADEVLRRCQEANALTLELWIRNGEGIQPEKSQVLTFGPEGAANLLLTAEDSGLFMQMSFASSDPQQLRPIRLCSLEGRQWRHLVLTYGNGKLTCYVDGRHLQTWAWQGDLSPWESGYFMLGDEWRGDGSTAWAGEIGAIAVYDRPLEVHEVFRNWRRLRVEAVGSPTGR